MSSNSEQSKRELAHKHTHHCNATKKNFFFWFHTMGAITALTVGVFETNGTMPVAAPKKSNYWRTSKTKPKQTSKQNKKNNPKVIAELKSGWNVEMCQNPFTWSLSSTKLPHGSSNLPTNSTQPSKDHRTVHQKAKRVRGIHCGKQCRQANEGMQRTEVVCWLVDYVHTSFSEANVCSKRWWRIFPLKTAKRLHGCSASQMSDGESVFVPSIGTCGTFGMMQKNKLNEAIQLLSWSSKKPSRSIERVEQA